MREKTIGRILLPPLYVCTHSFHSLYQTKRRVRDGLEWGGVLNDKAVHAEGGLKNRIE